MTNNRRASAAARRKVPSRRLASYAKGTCWMWVYCNACGRGVATALAPLIIRFGPDASGDVIRKGARCQACGGKGAMLMHPSWVNTIVGWDPFPTL